MISDLELVMRAIARTAAEMPLRSEGRLVLDRLLANIKELEGKRG